MPPASVATYRKDPVSAGGARAISDFSDYERPRHLAAARRVANAEQKAALRRLPARKDRRRYAVEEASRR